MAVKTPRWHTREDSGIRLDAELRWWHDDELIEHPKIIEAFNRGVRVRDDGKVTLELGNDWCFIQVEDAAFLVTHIDWSADGQCSVRLSDRTAEWLDADTLTGKDGVLYVQVKNRKAWAKFSRAAQAELGEAMEIVDDVVVLRHGQRTIRTPLTPH